MGVLTAAQRESLCGWLVETGELYVDLYVSHSGRGSTEYFLRSVDELEALISEQTGYDLQICVFRHMQYPLRGTANELLLSKVLEQIVDGRWYHIVSPEHFYPSECELHGSGNSHAELRKDFAKVMGKRVAIGENPFDGDDKWVFTSPDKVLVLNLKKGASGGYIPE